jgi:Protein of unknown function (DUF2934)
MTSPKAVSPALQKSTASSPQSPANLHEQISRRAYEIYEKRGMQDGSAEQDWLQAESELSVGSTFKAVA